MSSAVDIQIVSAPNLEKIENFFKDVSYRETIEFSASFNSHLCNERRLRLPFFDSQTGVAQNSSQLFLNKRQRMPGFRQGQIYTYPAARWRKSRRQYLNRMYRFPDRPFQALRKEHEALLAGGNVATSFSGTNIGTTISSGVVSSGAVGIGSGTMCDADFNGSVLLEESSSLGGVGGDTSDSKDSQHQHLKEELPREWFYEEMDMNDADSLEEQKSPADDEYDYDPRYGSKKRRKRRTSKKATQTPGECGSGNSRRRIVSGRGRSLSSADTISPLDSFESLSGDAVATPTSSVRRPRTGAGTRGRRRVKISSANSCGPPSPVRISEPPSFESAAAAVGNMDDLSIVVEHGELRNYRKYL